MRPRGALYVGAIGTDAPRRRRQGCRIDREILGAKSWLP